MLLQRQYRLRARRQAVILHRVIAGENPAMKKAFAALFVAVAVATPALADPLTMPIDCADCAVWNQAEPPVPLYGGSWYVGVAGLSSVLIATKEGLILLDGDLPQSVPLIEANLKALGHDVREVKLILVSHEHFDHVG